MNRKITLVGIPLLLASAAIQASNDNELTEHEMQQTRNQSQLEQQLMGDENQLQDRVRNQQFNRNDEGEGYMNREGDGKGGKYRHREKSQYKYGEDVGSGYGSGYGSRNGGDSGSGNGSGNGSGSGSGNGPGNGSGQGGGKGQQ